MNNSTAILFNDPFTNALFSTETIAIACFDPSLNIIKYNNPFEKLLDLEQRIEYLLEIEWLNDAELESIIEPLRRGEIREYKLIKNVENKCCSSRRLSTKWIGVYQEEEFVGGWLIIEDITPRKALSASNLFRNLYEKSPLGILMICNTTAKILHANPMICKMLGYEEEELKTLTAYDITYVDDRKKHKPKFEDALKNDYSPFNFEKRYVRKNGEIIWVNIATSTIKDAQNQPLHNLATIQDITGKHRAKELIESQLIALDEQNKKLEKYIDSNLQLENFAYIASHDLKAPLRTIGNFTQLLKRKISKSLTTEELEYMDLVLQGVYDMKKLIDDLLMYSTINGRKTEVEEVRLPKLLKAVKRNLAATISEKKALVEWDGNIPELIMANTTELKQLFQNLIANGIKFQEANTTPEVKISCKETATHWSFEVKDNGLGIEEEYFNQIFTLFKRLHSKKDFDGSGIGLAYCKRVVERHGGKIWLNSTLGQGTNFFFTIQKNIDQEKK